MYFKKKEEKSEEKSRDKIEKSINDGIIFIKMELRDIKGHIFIFQLLLIWQKNYLKQKIKRKTVTL